MEDTVKDNALRSTPLMTYDLETYRCHCILLTYKDSKDNEFRKGLLYLCLFKILQNVLCGKNILKKMLDSIKGDNICNRQAVSERR